MEMELMESIRRAREIEEKTFKEYLKVLEKLKDEKYADLRCSF
jgi:rubrerythrin